MVLAALLLTGCGYHFAGGEESVGPAFRTVFVDVFANKTGEAYAENIFRTAFISRFVQEGRFTASRSRGEADVICRGTIRSLQTSPLAYKTTNFAAENRITVILEIAFEERESGRTIWTDRAMTGTGDYTVTSVNLTESTRKNALTKLANDTAERAYRLMMSGF
jgi:hypothetical protein